MTLKLNSVAVINFYGRFADEEREKKKMNKLQSNGAQKEEFCTFGMSEDRKKESESESESKRILCTSSLN